MAFQCSLQWSEREGTHRRRERKCPERHRDGTAGEPAAVSLLTINTAFEHIEETLVDVQVVHAGGQDQNPKERIDAARENVQRVNETELPVNQSPCLSLLTMNSAFEHIEDMQYACDASKLNTRHRRAPLKRLQVVHRLDKVIVINGLGADYVPPSLPVELIPKRNGDYTQTTTSPRCVEKRLGLQRLLMYR